MASPRRYRFGPLERRALVGPLRTRQVAVLGGAVAAGLACLYALRSFAGLALAVLFLCAAAGAMFVPIEGRSAEEWAPVALGWALRRRGAAAGYRSASPTAGARVGAGGEARHDLSLPPTLAGLELISAPYGREEVGVMRDRRAGTYTALLAVRAGAFGLREATEQERKLDAWGVALAAAARDGSPVRRLQWIERAVPAEGDQLAAHLQAERDRTVALDSSLVRSYIDLIESAAPVSQEHEILVAVQIEERRASREMRRLGGGEEAACRLLLREAESLAERLSLAELSVYGVLRPRQYAAALRDAFDPYGRRARARSALGDPEREGVEPALMGPLAEEAGWSSYRTDSAFHTTYWISSWPRTDVGAAFLTPLLMQTAALRSVAVTIEPIPHSVATRRAEAARTAEVAEEMARERQGFLTTAQARRRQQAAARCEEELADGHAEMHFAGYLTVSAPTLEQLDRAAADMEHAAQLSRLELQRLYGEQEAAFTFTLPLARGLR